jgi:superfamily II DNA or RNA helicase
MAQRQDVMPALREARSLELDFVDPDDDGDEEEEGEEDYVARVAPPQRSRGRTYTPSWRDVLSYAAAKPVAPPTRRRELRYVIDAESSRQRGRLVVRPMEKIGRGERVSWRQLHIPRPFAHHADPEDALLLAMMDGLSSAPGSYFSGSLAEFELPCERWVYEVLQRLCGSGRARAGNPEKPPLRWDAEPYALVLEGCWDEGAADGLVAAAPAADGLVAAAPFGHAADMRVRAWLERGDERVSVKKPLLVLDGGLVLWPDRIAPFDDCGQFAWVVNERGRGPALLPVAEVEDFLEAMHQAPRQPRLRLPPEHELPEARAPGRPYAVLSTGREMEVAVVAVEAGLEYDGVRAPLETTGRAIVDHARRRLLVRDEAAEGVAREQLVRAGGRPLPHLYRLGSGRSVGYRLAPGRLESAVRDLVGCGWRVEVDGRLRRSGEAFSIEVSTGIDWLDVRVRATFEGIDVPLPELLAALKQRRRTVTLADGSEGDLSDASVDRLRRWAGMAEPSSGALRFRKTQTALVSALVEGEGERACFDDAFARARRELRVFEGITPRTAPRTFQGTLRDYQRHALGWFEALRRFGFGGCLADDMGLGKTVQVLAMLDARRREQSGPSLVVAPRSVLANWAAEAARFTPRLRVLVHDGADRETPGDHFRQVDLVLTTYGLLRQDALPLSRVEFDYVVLDEAQAIKTASTASAAAARALRGRHRLALSGTPLENHLGELASLLDFLNPGVLGTAASLASLSDGSRRIDAATRDVLARAVRPFFLRRTKREVAPELPERVEQTVFCDLPEEQRRLYDQLHGHYRQSVIGGVEQRGVAGSTAHILEALLRLRQAACHPGLLDPARRGEGSAKLDVLLDRLETLRAEGQKALVFSQFTSLLAIVRDRLDERGIVYEYLDGGTRDRSARVARFQSDDRCGVFLLSLKAGGVGLNLTAAEYVFVLDPWWNPAVEAQAIDRAHRIGQTRAVFAYKLLARDTVEEKVAQLQSQKRELAEALFGEGTAALSGLTREDLEQLLA